jgi:predicted phosphodiesterase
MRIAVLSDIHGNLPALRTVIADVDAWQPDLVVVGGDIVNRGPESGACFDVVYDRHKQDGWALLRGNHEEFVLDCANPDRPTSGPFYEMTRFAHFALEQINGRAPLLANLPDLFEWAAPDGSLLRVVHASMRSNRDGVYPATPDAVLREQIGTPPAVFVTGHTHRPLIRQIDRTLVVNIGSVGSPFDSDQRPSYGRFTWNAGRWEADLVRLDYDFAQIEQAYVESGFLAQGGALAQLMLVELRKAHGLIFRWASRYEDAVATGAMTLEESVRAVLSDDDVRPFTGPPGWVI